MLRVSTRMADCYSQKVVIEADEYACTHAGALVESFFPCLSFVWFLSLCFLGLINSCVIRE